MDRKQRHYIDYDDYVAMGGAFKPTGDDSREFDRLRLGCENLIDRHTSNRIKNMDAVPEAVGRVLVELIDLESAYSARGLKDSPMVTSASNDGVSVSYGAIISSASELERAKVNIIQTYLSCEADDDGVPLLYRGVKR